MIENGAKYSETHDDDNTVKVEGNDDKYNPINTCGNKAENGEERKDNNNINNMKKNGRKKTNTHKSQEGMVINALSLPVIYHL